MTSGKRLTRAERIAKERAEMGLAPWQFSPSQVHLGDNPYTDPSAAGHGAYAEAQRQRREIENRDPEYFWDDPAVRPRRKSRARKAKTK